MLDFAAARRNMVEGQVRTADVTDLRIISAMLEIPREAYVPAGKAALAYLDRDVPFGAGTAARCLLKPMLLARLIHAADIGPADSVLDVGCGSGYAAAVLARLAAHVVALEEDAALAQSARKSLGSLSTVKVETGALAGGWPGGGPYDAIIVEGATEIVPEQLLSQLKVGGRLVCVLGGGPGAKATLYRRGTRDVGGRSIFDAAAPMLPGFVRPPEFAF